MVVFIRIPSWWGRRAAHPENVMSPLDIGYAVALLARRGITAEIIDVEASNVSYERVQELLRVLRPSHVFLHAITPAVPDALRLAQFAQDELRSVRKVVLIGQHATVLPETVLGAESPIDLCLRGEFEQDAERVALGAEPSSAAYYEDGAVQTVGGTCETEDLDALPFPAHERFRSRRYRVFHPTGVRRRWRWGFLMSSRGCPFQCIYCSPTLRNSYGKKYRVRSTESVIEELELLGSLGFTIVHFKDDIFTLNKERIVALCEAMLSRKMRVSWTAQTRPDTVDRPLLELMQRAGCRTLGFGVETGSERMIERLCKGNQLDDVHNAFQWAREVGIRTVGFFILGSPGETEEDVAATRALMRRIRPNIIQVSFFTPYPGAPTYDEALSSRFDMRDFSHYNSLINLSAISDERLRALQRAFYLDFLTKTGFVRDYVGSEWLPALINADQFLPFLKLSGKFLFGRHLTAT
jgi:radical SAM superfamily enzyme YgiQ (UPF0313 family)